MKSILQEGDTVSLEFDIQRRDRYGRLLAYIYLSDGRMLNDQIIESGYAYIKKQGIRNLGFGLSDLIISNQIFVPVIDKI